MLLRLARLFSKSMKPEKSAGIAFILHRIQIRSFAKRERRLASKAYSFHLQAVAHAVRPAIKREDNAKRPTQLK
jgi:hypothetical protein